MSLFLALFWQGVAFAAVLFVGFQLMKVLVLGLIRDDATRSERRARYYSTEEQLSTLRSAMFAGFVVAVVSVFSLTTGPAVAVACAWLACLFVGGIFAGFIESVTKPKAKTKEENTTKL